MKTKKQLENEGWIFVTLDGGSIIATNSKFEKCYRALSILTLRKKISTL